MKVLLLLAGRSKRFWPLTEKTLFPVCGKTLLEHQVDRLRKSGCADIVLVGGAHNLQEAKIIFPDFESIEQEDLELGMRGALLSALPSCGDRPVMIVSGNDVIDSSGYEALRASASQSEVQGSLLAQQVTQYFPGGYLSLNRERISSIVEKPGEGNEPSDLVNIVAHVHRDASLLLEALVNVKNSRDDGYEQALAALFEKYDYRAVPYEGVWCAVKYPWHMLSLLSLFLKDVTPQIHPSASVHPSATIDGPVFIDEGAKVFAHATIRGPCVIGKRSIVANNALVRDSSVGDDCVVGYNTEVKGSVLSSHVWTHMSYVGDSVIGSNVSFGGGCITGNLRLDEKEIVSKIDGEKFETKLTKFGVAIGNDCRLGIQVGLNPGIKIGGGTFINGGVFVTEDIPEKSFVKMKGGKLCVIPNTSSPPHTENRQAFFRNPKGKTS